MAVMCSRGTCSNFHVGPSIGLTYTASCGSGKDSAMLVYTDGTREKLGRFWTEILPSRMHRVVASTERRTLTVYLPQKTAYVVKDSTHEGPTQIVFGTGFGHGVPALPPHRPEWKRDRT
eukprot:1532145-Amphidinium_carterae.4